MRVVQTVWSAALVAIVVGCSSAPTIPTGPQPFTQDVSGDWSGEVTLTSFDGGECLAATFHDIAGLPGQFHANLTQNGLHVAGIMDVDHTGAQCTFTGTLDGDELMLTASSCTGTKTLALPCANGAVRGLLPETESLRATIGAGRIDGSALESDNVVISGTQTSVGRFTGRSSFVLTRNRL